MAYVFDRAILVLKPIVHFLLCVVSVLGELIECVLLDALDLRPLTIQLISELVDEVTLHFLALLLLLQDGVFDLFRVRGQIIQDHALVADALVAFLIQIAIVLLNLSVNWRKLVV